MTDKTAATSSVLDMMTAGVMARKANAAAKLTPVSGEVTPIHVAVSPVEAAYRTPAAFPFDDPQTTILALQKARAEVMHVLDGIDALLALYGSEPAVRAVVPDPDAERKAAEREADKRIAAQGGSFAEQYDKLQAEAQAAVFKEPVTKVTEAVTMAPITKDRPIPIGWVCPEHGTFEKRLSRKGREYRACTDCDEFERL